MEHDVRKILIIIIGMLFFVGIIIIGFLGFRKYEQGPQIKSISIQQGMTTPEVSLEITGILKNVQGMYINGRNIKIHKDTSFHEIVALYPGVNTINISLEDNFKKTREYNYTIYSSFVDTPYPANYTEALEQQEDTSPDLYTNSEQVETESLEKNN